MVKTQMLVEVAYADENAQALIPIEVAIGTTVLEAIHHSKILLRFPEVHKLEGQVGIFGQPVALDRILQTGDRIEIYRPLKRDPKQARRDRAHLRNTQRASSTR